MVLEPEHERADQVVGEAAAGADALSAKPKVKQTDARPQIPGIPETERKKAEQASRRKKLKELKEAKKKILLMTLNLMLLMK